MADESIIVVKIDLDRSAVDKSFVALEKESAKSAKAVGDNYEKALGKTFSKDLNKNIDETGKSLGRVTQHFKDYGKQISLAISVIGILESRYGLITKATDRLGLSFEDIKQKFSNLTEAFSDFKIGEASFGKLKIAAFSFVQELGIIDSKLIKLLNAFAAITTGVAAFGTLASQLGAITIFLGPIIGNLKEIGQLTIGITGILFKSGGLFGAVSSLGGLSLGLAAISESLKQYEGNLIAAIRSTILFASIITGSLAAALSIAIVKVAEYSEKIGTELVKGFKNASSEFSKADSGLEIFSKTVGNFNNVTDGAVGSTNSWLDEIDNISKAFNISNTSLTKASQEIIQVGSQLGLQEDQLKSLVKVTAEYAKINKKDVFDTSVAIVSALNGQSQAVQSLGIKLNEASVQQFAYKKGVTENIRSLASGEVVQLRFNKLLDQYKNISGIAAVAAGSLADQQQRLVQNQQRLSVAIGKGASVIENNNILAAGYNLILNNINENILAVTGFVGALGARFLQFGGILLGLSFKFFVVIKVLKILQLTLSNKLSIDIFASQIPKLNKSLNDLISGLAKTEVKITSLKSLINSLKLITVNSFDSISRAITGFGLKGLTVFNAIKGSISKLIPILLTASKALVAFLIPLAPFIIKAALIAAAVFALYKAFQRLEERTGALSVIWGVLVELFNEGVTVFQPIVTLFGKMTQAIKTFVSQGLGLMIAGLTKVLDLIISLAQNDFFKKFFNQDQLDRLTIASLKLNKLGGDLEKVAFDFTKLGNDSEEAGRKIAGSFAKINPEDLASLQNELKNVGKSQLQVLQETQAKRFALLDGGLREGLLTQVRFEELRNQVILDFNAQRDEITRAQREKEAAARAKSFDDIVSLQNQLSQFGLTELEKIDFQQQTRLDKINGYLESELISYQQAENLKSQIIAQGNAQRLAETSKNLNALNYQEIPNVNFLTLSQLSAYLLLA